MTDTIKAALITGILGFIATIAAAIIGVHFGKTSEQKNIQNEINEVLGNVVNITGNDNEVTVNNIKDLVDEYQRLQSQNKSLLDQNSKYFSDLTEANYQVNALQSKANDMPSINFNNLSLSIDARDIPINKNNSMVTIDGKDYFSKEIIEKLIPNNQNMTIKDDTLFIGKVIAVKANLYNQRVVDSFIYDNVDNIVDSYGNIHTNTLCFNPSYYNSRDAYVVFNLDNKFNYLDMSISISENTQANSHGILIIKADDNVVYTSEQLVLTTKPFSIKNIPINNCSLLTINYNYNGFNQCIISDAIVYN